MFINVVKKNKLRQKKIEHGKRSPIGELIPTAIINNYESNCHSKRNFNK